MDREVNAPKKGVPRLDRYHRIMEEATANHNLITRLSHAIGLSEQYGWAVPAGRWLGLWFLGNLGWIVGGLVTVIHLPAFRPPPGWTYWSLWCVGASVAVVCLAIAVARLPIKRQHGWLLYGLLSLGMCVLEEALCYLLGAGMWESRSRFFPEFLVGVAVLMGWSVGSALVLGLSGLGAWEALILCGFSGWLAEAFVVPRFFQAPLLLIWIIPLSIVSYVLLILPGIAVVGRYLPQPPVNRRWRVRPYLAAILIPVGCWLGMAILMGLFFRV
jgi:hypothetical protein